MHPAANARAHPIDDRHRVGQDGQLFGIEGRRPQRNLTIEDQVSGCDEHRRRAGQQKLVLIGVWTLHGHVLCLVAAQRDREQDAGTGRQGYRRS